MNNWIAPCQKRQKKDQNWRIKFSDWTQNKEITSM